MRPIVLGVSGRAIVTQAYLARHPRHPRHAGRAVLVNASSRFDRTVLAAGFAALGGPEDGKAAEAIYARGALEDAPAFFRRCLPFYSRSGTFDASKGRRNAPDLQFRRQPVLCRADGEAWRFDHHRGALDQVACPVLVMSGAHDPMTRPEWGREIAEALPRGLVELALFEGSSHVITADEPDRFCNIVDRFIAAG